MAKAGDATKKSCKSAKTIRVYSWKKMHEYVTWRESSRWQGNPSVQNFFVIAVQQMETEISVWSHLREDKKLPAAHISSELPRSVTAANHCVLIPYCCDLGFGKMG